jgi:hypothetical protein
MSEKENKLELSRMAYKNVEILVERYVNAIGKVANRKEHNEITDAFTMAFNGMTMLMTDEDAQRAVDLLHSNGMVNEIKKSIKRIKKDGSNLSTC